MRSAPYLGMMSGTSMDGVDAVIARFPAGRTEIVGSLWRAYPQSLKSRLNALVEPTWRGSLSSIQDLDHQVGQFHADIARELIAQTGVTPNAIGFHGQTINHQPDSACPNTWQIGDPNLIVATTGVTTIADWRRHDIALGGQGAPLTPAFHAWAFRRDVAVGVLNLGGIANLTAIPPESETPVIGFDCGPANTLMDLWSRRHGRGDYDANGDWAASGVVNATLLKRMRSDPYFSLAPPKSTGREHFHQQWLNHHLQDLSVAPEDVQATLAELTALAIVDAIDAWMPEIREIFICGGGIHNHHLTGRLEALGSDRQWRSTAEAGIPPDEVEALAFAWFASQTLAGQPLALSSVTGARDNGVAGAIYRA